MHIDLYFVLITLHRSSYGAKFVVKEIKVAHYSRPLQSNAWLNELFNITILISRLLLNKALSFLFKIIVLLTWCKFSAGHPVPRQHAAFEPFAAPAQCYAGQQLYANERLLWCLPSLLQWRTFGTNLTRFIIISSSVTFSPQDVQC